MKGGCKVGRGGGWWKAGAACLWRGAGGRREEERGERRGEERSDGGGSRGRCVSLWKDEDLSKRQQRKRSVAELSQEVTKVPAPPC